MGRICFCLRTFLLENKAIQMTFMVRSRPGAMELAPILVPNTRLKSFRKTLYGICVSTAL